MGVVRNADPTIRIVDRITKRLDVERPTFWGADIKTLVETVASLRLQLAESQAVAEKMRDLVLFLAQFPGIANVAEVHAKIDAALSTTPRSALADEVAKAEARVLRRCAAVSRRHAALCGPDYPECIAHQFECEAKAAEAKSAASGENPGGGRP